MPACTIIGHELNSVTGAPLTIVPALRSWDLGELSGQPVASTTEKIKAYMQTPDKAIPGGESWNTFVSRYLDFLEPHWKQPGYCALVTHGRNIMVARAWLNAGAEGQKLDDGVLSADYTNFVRHGGWVTAGGERVLDGFC